MTNAGGNTSSAVRAQRVEPHDSLDFFPTPPWATRALCVHVLPQLGVTRADQATQFVWEPACGLGHMARPLGEYFKAVYASDVHDYRDRWPAQMAVGDFLIPQLDPALIKSRAPDWVITNPPFRLAPDFVRRAGKAASVGFAMLVRTAFLEGVERWRTLFAPDPPALVAQFAERVPMVKGRYDPAATTATAYAWLVWHHGARRAAATRFFWIPPSRAELIHDVDRLYNPGGPDAETAAPGALI